MPAMKDDPDKALTMMQRLFVEAYFTCNYNATEACRVAGYTGQYLDRQGYELLNKPHIKKAIEVRAQERLKEVSVNVEYVLRKLVRAVEKGESQDNHNAVLRGCELLGKHLAMFTEKTEITGKDGEAIKYEKVEQDAADFARTIAGLASRSGEDESPLRVIAGGKSPA
jgi:phage terminase small subunit